jgi:hypothetical protein
VSAREVVTIVSRAVAFYLLCWALIEMTYLPSSVISLVHDRTHLTALGPQTYWRDRDVLSISLLALRIVALVAAARWLYRGGPGVERYFFGARDPKSPSGQPS